MSSALHVLVVSESKPLVAILTVLLGRADDIAYLGSASTVYEAVSRVEAVGPDLVVATSPPASVSEVLAWRTVRESGATVLFLTTYLLEGNDVRAMLTGAAGVVLIPETDLVESIRRAGHGEALRSPHLDGRLEELVSSEAVQQLNPDDRTMLQLLIQGCSDSEISTALNSDSAGVSADVARILQRIW